ncbi:CPK2 [Symbiodinium natans]|uniref:CPK2 protein n=1 Tax=Symbiodinium natans TaxID=878477 RepID=A0A812KML6_9DINO|nr:CPK2 [Symbiodinium natans]
MGAAAPKCRLCQHGGDEERAGGLLDLPGVQVMPDQDITPTYATSDASEPGSPSSPLSPRSSIGRSRKASSAAGAETDQEMWSGAEDDVDQDDFDWKKFVSPMLGIKANDAELQEISARVGGDFEVLRDIEQEELNREELRVERVSKVVNPVPAKRIDTERMVRASIRHMQDARGFTTEALAEEVAKLQCAEAQDGDKNDDGNEATAAYNTKLNKHISRAIVPCLHAATVTVIGDGVMVT